MWRRQPNLLTVVRVCRRDSPQVYSVKRVVGSSAAAPRGGATGAAATPTRGDAVRTQRSAFKDGPREVCMTRERIDASYPPPPSPPPLFHHPSSPTPSPVRHTYRNAFAVILLRLVISYVIFCARTQRVNAPNEKRKYSNFVRVSKSDHIIHVLEEINNKHG